VIAADLRACTLLASLDEAALVRLSESLETLCFPAGERLFKQGDYADGLLLIGSGSVALQHAVRGDCGQLGPGASFGGASLVAAGIREVSAVVECDCTLWWLSESGFRTLIDEEPRVACQLLEAIACELANCARAALDSLPCEVPAQALAS